MDKQHINAPQETAQQVDEAARLFDEYGNFIRATLRHFVRDPQEQEELYQDLFVYFARKPVPKDTVRVRGWVYRVILDRVRDRKRRQSRYKNRLLDYASKCPPSSGDSNDPLSDEEQVAIVFARINEHLNDRQARAVLYKYRHNLEVEEIAQRLNLHPSTVMSYISVGIRKLRTLLNKDDQ